MIDAETDGGAAREKINRVAGAGRDLRPPAFQRLAESRPGRSASYRVLVVLARP
jgi:hypothetical protein